MIESEPTL